MFSDGPERATSAVPFYDKHHYNKQVEVALQCGDPAFGFSQYLCLNFGKDSRIAAHLCKSKCCLRCERVDGENFAQSIVAKLYENVDYRPAVPTIPTRFTSIIYWNRFSVDLYRDFLSTGWRLLKIFMDKFAGVSLEFG